MPVSRPSRESVKVFLEWCVVVVGTNSEYNLTLSAYNLDLVSASNISHTSFIKTVNSSEPMQLPWTTPLGNGNVLDTVFPTREMISVEQKAFFN